MRHPSTSHPKDVEMLTHSAVNSNLPQLALIVVPDGTTRRQYRQFLVPRGFVVEEATEGSEALAKAICDPPDIIITERELPDLAGDHLCQLFREDRDTRLVPIVLLINHADIGTVSADSVADSVLLKPCAPDTLFAEMKRVRDQSVELRSRAKRVRGQARRLVAQSGDVVHGRVRPAHGAGKNDL